MRENVTVSGVVLKAAPSKETDRRLVVLTRERGKITVFAKGARRPGSSFMAACRPFVFATFSLYEGREAYNLKGAEVADYFDGLAENVENTCYASYFLEIADYYTRENMRETQLMVLLYQTFKALLKPVFPKELIRRVFELKAMVLNGEYAEKPPGEVSSPAAYAWEFVVVSPSERLYTFTLTPEVLAEFSKCVEMNRKRFIDREFKSLEILKDMVLSYPQ
ncbi:DNA repair protein RecO [Lachnospiraceae bacterium 62-35]